jgi:hypothetical protein
VAARESCEACSSDGKAMRVTSARLIEPSTSSVGKMQALQSVSLEARRVAAREERAEYAKTGVIGR